MTGVPRAHGVRRFRTALARRIGDAHTGPMPDEAPWAEPVVVPDDLRALQADVDAYHREQRLLARRERIERATAWLPPFVTARLVGRFASAEPVAGPSVWTRLALPIAAFVGVLGAASLVLAVLLIGTPRPQPGPVAEPVAKAPAAAVGSVGGLLPDVRVTTPGGVVSVRSLRPALIALVP